MINVTLQFLELDLVNINVSAKFYQNIPKSLRVKFHCFQNLNLGKTLTNHKCHLTISWATSSQYQCVCKILSKYSQRFKSYRHFSRTGRRQMIIIRIFLLFFFFFFFFMFIYLFYFFLENFVPFLKIIRIVFFIIIILFHFSLFQNLALGKASTDDKCHFAIP